VNIALLDRLKEAEGAFVAACELGEDPVALSRDLDELEAFGFGIERHPYLGAAYRGPASRLCPDQIEQGLGTLRIGRRIAVWDRVTSTSDLAARASDSRANDGLVILAESQTSGRGRLGRAWVAPSGSSLLMSCLIFPPPALGAPGWLTALGAVAVAEVIEAATGSPARIKWPNDVRVGGRKVCGVLVERAEGVVIGIGLNVNTRPEDFPDSIRSTATSLRALDGVVHDRSELARALIRRLDALYADGREHGPESLDAAWSSRLEALGQTVRVVTSRGERVGRLRRADLRSGLVIEDASGTVETIAAGEVQACSPLSFDQSPNTA
jgi:BirA family biotin operon repressor/biotin-[acetyl-CoA-carboxylase] ligase